MRETIRRILAILCQEFTKGRKLRASRLLSLQLLLQAHGRMTAAELARRLEVSVRTIYRDVDALSAAGVPLYADRGPAGGIALVDGYRTTLTGFTSAEALALLFLALPDAAQDLDIAAAVTASQLKMFAALPGPAATNARILAQRFHVDPVTWYRRTSAPPCLKVVAQAVWDGRQVRIDYESWSRRTWRDVDPLGLVLKAGDWYLVAAEGRRPTIFALKSVHEAEVLAAEAIEPTGFVLAEYWRAELERLERDRLELTATIRVAPSAMSLLHRLDDAMAAPIRDAAPGDDGWRETIVPIESVNHAAGNLLGFADTIEVIEPEVLCRELRRRAEAVQRLYRQE
jgi:predicted DNA-binding transcriptional regulator YafY